MTTTSALSDLLPHDMPECGNERLLLHTFRRIAANGLNDAHAAHAMLTFFGRSYRRPLVLLRAFAAELSRISGRRLTIGPCCCARMTHAESALVNAVATCLGDPRAAHAGLARMLGVRECVGALCSAQALAQAFADCGRPLRG